MIRESAMRMNIVLVIGACVLLSGCALNQDVKSLERRILQMEIKVQQLKDQMESQQTRDNRLKDQYAGQSAEFYQLKEEVARLNGRIDETEHHIDQALKKNADAIARFNQPTPGSQTPESGTAAGSLPLGAESPQLPAPAAMRGDGTFANLPEKEIYDIAKQAYDREDYETARQGFAAFLKKYPTSDEADNARFWIGESYFKEGWFQKAILEYQDVIEKYPNDNKVPSAYLKQGLAFDKLGETANARLVFQELLKRFPNSSEAKTARQKLSQLE